MNFRTLDDLDVRGKRVLVREDLNVPMKDGAMADATRVDAAIPTLKLLSDRGARVVVLSHLGRPDGQVNLKYSLRPIAPELSRRLGRPVAFAEDCIGASAHAAVKNLADGDIVLLENVRFYAGEEANQLGFAFELASLGDIYVNDAFGTAHRAHASTVGVARLLPNAAGLLMQAELRALGTLIDHPIEPYVCVIGGAKVKDKIGVFTNLMERVTAFCIGGGMANTFLAAQGVEVGKSLRDDDLAPARTILALAKERGVALHLPNDAVVAPAFDADDRAHVVPIDTVGDEMILDIGPDSANAYAAALADAKTIVFNGPMGVYEKSAYQNGTKIVGEAIARATQAGAFSVVGGGDAAAAAHILGFADRMSHVSTGGGATLEFLEGKVLPGVAALCGVTMRRLVVGNWKMNKTSSETARFIDAFAEFLLDIPDSIEVAIAPPMTSLGAASVYVSGTRIELAAQNMHWEKCGAFTGEVSAEMLVNLEVTYVIIGHSERRELFGETDATVNKKVLAALANRLRPIICVGETLAQRDAGHADAIVAAQTRAALNGVATADLANVVLAYEPVWAIGTGRNCDVDQADATMAAIRASVDGLATVRILYGGSMKPENVAAYSQAPNINGGLVGGASLDPVAFAALIRAAHPQGA